MTSIPGAADILDAPLKKDLRPVHDDPIQTDFSSLTHFNVTLGLRRTQGDPLLYRRLLRKFLDGNSDFEAAFLAATRACDPRTAERLAHTLKGLAATIEAEAVAKSAALLERACREGHDPARLTPVLQSVLTSLLPCLNQLRAFFGDSALSPAAAPACDEAVTVTPAMAEALRQVAALLQDGDADATEALDHFLAKYAKMRHPLARIQQLAGGYDFFGAHDELVKLAESWGMVL